MNLKLYAPRGPQFSHWPGFGTLNNRLGRLFEDQPEDRTTGWTPPVSVQETADAIVLTAEVPGLTLKDLTVELENNVLTVSGEKREAPEGEQADGVEGVRIHVSERRYGSFRRSFTLPRRVDADQIDARFENGVLTVSLPKAAEAKSRMIEVKS